MAGFWERLFDPPSPEKNQVKLASANRQMTAINRRQRIEREQSAEKDASQDATIRQLREELRDSRTEVAALTDELDRLTRCLFANGVIEQADLDSMLPESDVQD